MHGNVQCYSPTIYNEKFELNINIWLLGVMAFPIKLVVYKYKF